MGNHFTNIITTFALVALATTLVLPGRQTAQVASATLNGFGGLTKAALGE